MANLEKQKKAAAEFLHSAAALSKTALTMQDIHDAIMSRNPSADAWIIFDEAGKPVKGTYEDFRDQVFKTASKLSNLLSGTAPGSVVGLKLKNSQRWGIFFFALLMSGHNPLLIDARLPEANTNNLLTQSRAQAIVCNDEAEFCVPQLRVNDVLNQPFDYNFRPDWANHVIFCSSGTTGDAKMMAYDGASLCAQIVAAYDMGEETADIMYPKGDCRILAMLPMHHIFGFVAVFLWYSYFGKTIVYPNSQATGDLLYACRKGKVTHLYSVPLFWDSVAQTVNRTIAQMKPSTADVAAKMIAYNTNKISRKEAGLGGSKMAKKKIQKKLLGTYIRFAISGGGYCSPNTLTVINGLGYPLYNGYGMTEVGVTSVELSPNVAQRLKGSIGRPLHGVTYHIGDPTKPEVEQGELFIKSKITHGREFSNGFMKHTGFVGDGYYPTGDIVVKDAQGYYYMKGRIKDTIILANGENVYPDEIEYYFKDIKHINNLCCFGAKDPDDGVEKITLVVEVDNSVTPEDIKKIYADIRSINNNLANEKKVQKILIDKRPLPVSGSMKIKRQAVKKAVEAGSNDFFDAEAKKEKKAVSFEGYDKALVEETLSKVIAIFSKVLVLPELKIDPAGIWTTDLGGDSMSYIEMVQLIDKEFGCNIPEEEYGESLATAQDFTKRLLDLGVTKKKSKKAK